MSAFSLRGIATYQREATTWRMVALRLDQRAMRLLLLFASASARTCVRRASSLILVLRQLYIRAVHNSHIFNQRTPNNTRRSNLEAGKDCGKLVHNLCITISTQGEERIRMAMLLFSSFFSSFTPTLKFILPWSLGTYHTILRIIQSWNNLWGRIGQGFFLSLFFSFFLHLSYFLLLLFSNSMTIKRQDSTWECPIIDIM